MFVTNRSIHLAAIATAMFMLFFSGGCVHDSTVQGQANQFQGGIQPAIENDAPVNEYLQRIGTRIVAAAAQLDKEHVGPKSHFSEDSSWMFKPGAIQFHLVNSKTLNAFTTGGVHVYIYNELVQKTESEDELAAVMSHEFGHIYCRHVQAGMDRQYGLLGLAGLAGAGGYIAGGSEKGSDYASASAGAALAAGKFVGMGFTRNDEDQADEYGLKFYVRAGWDANKFADFFKRMIQMGYDTTPEMASDHPKLSTRVDHTAQRVAKLGADATRYRQPEVATQADFDAFKARAFQVASSTPDDKSLQTAQTLLDAFPSCVAPVDTQRQKDAKVKVTAMSQAAQDAAAKNGK